MIQPQRQTWNITWEGDLFGPSFTGQLGFEAADQARLTLRDSGVDFCQAGAVPGDVVTLFGCTVDSQCGPGQVCRRSDTAPLTADALPINGLCVPMDGDPRQSEVLTNCAPLLNSLRRYEIVNATSMSGSSTLTLRPEVDEIVSGSLLCGKEAAAGQGCGPANDSTRTSFGCFDVDGSTNLRCVQQCTDGSNKCRCVP